MTTVGLVMAGVALGVGALPHCALMCGAPCAAITGGRPAPSAGFQAGRIAGYMAGGAMAAGSLQWLGTWMRGVPALQPVWLLMHLAFLLLGLWWLATGRMPLMRDARQRIRLVHRRGHALRAGAIGLAWIALPCGALQGALLLSALADDAAGGALVMAAFAFASMPALGAAPWLWARVRQFGGARMAGAHTATIGYRLAGLALVASSGWAMAHALREQLAAFCTA
ncbi:MAG: sulfite exporter TauE/SafE family protein [Vitreoscilla sp.]